MPTCLLNISGDGKSLGSLPQYLATLSAKNFVLISHLNLPWCNRETISSYRICKCDGKVGLKTEYLKGCKSFYFLVLFVAAILSQFLSGFIKDFVAS